MRWAGLPADAVQRPAAAWSLIGAMLVIDLIWAPSVGLSIGGWWQTIAAVGVLLLVAGRYRHRSRTLVDMASSAALWIAFSATGCVLTYLGATCAMPLQDAALTRLDQALGFDWVGWRDWVAAWPAVNLALSLAYPSLMLQILLSGLLLPLLGLAGRSVELAFLAALTILPTTAVSALWPALGPFATFGGERAEYLPHVLLLRAPGPWHFDLPTMQGILTMPSYHAVLALLFTYACRGTGWLGWAVAAVNAAMLLSIAPIGGHYLMDIIVGLAIAALCILAVRGAAARLPSPGQPAT